MKDMTCGTTQDVLHGLINYIDTKAKCRNLKNLPAKGLCGRCLSEFMTGDTVSHVDCWLGCSDFDFFSHFEV
jgi:hypothetical protein